MRISCLFIFITIVTSIVSFQAFAKTYKCKDQDGKITYSQTACSANQSTDKVISGGSSGSKSNNCIIASKFATEIAKNMKSDIDADQVFSGYGGVDSLSKASINIINYVYTYKHDNKITVQRISALAQAKCEAKSFGSLGCNDFPIDFASGINECGDDEAVSGTAQGDEPVMQDEIMTDTQPETNAIDEKAAEKAAKQRKEQEILACKSSYQSKIDNIDRKMKAGYSSSEGERLRAERRSLLKSMDTNCR